MEKPSWGRALADTLCVSLAEPLTCGRCPRFGKPLSGSKHKPNANANADAHAHAHPNPNPNPNPNAHTHTKRTGQPVVHSGGFPPARGLSHTDTLTKPHTAASHRDPSLPN